MMAPDGSGTYAPQERYFVNGESFSLTVNRVFPPSRQFDMVFFGGSVCNYQLSLKSIEIIC